NIGTRLGAGFAVVLVALVGLGAFSLHSLSRSNDMLQASISRDAAKLEAAMVIDVTSRAAMRRILEIALTTDDKARKEALERMAANYERGNAAQETLKKLVFTPEGKEMVAKIAQARAQMQEHYAKVQKLADAKDSAEAVRYSMGELRTEGNKLTAL